MSKEKRAGNQSDNGWKTAVWTKVAARLAEEHPNANPSKAADKCQDHFGVLKAKYKMLKVLKDKSGFGWDEERKMVMATDLVWETYIKAHSGAKWFKTHAFPLFYTMAELVDGTVATGAAAFHAGPENVVTPSASAPNRPALFCSQSLQSSHEDLNSPPRAPHMHQPTGTPRRPLQDHTNTPKHAYNDEITGNLSDDGPEQLTSGYHKRQRATMESPEPSSSERKGSRRPKKRNAEAAVDVADAIRHLSKSIAPPLDPVVKALKLVQDDGDFSDSDDEASVLTLFTLRPEMAAAFLGAWKRTACTAFIKQMLDAENL